MQIGRTLAVALTLSVAAATAAPAPAEAQGRRNWELTVTGAKLGRVAVPSPLGHRSSYWFFVFTIENDTGADRPLPLFVRGFDDEERTFHEGIYPAAEKIVEDRLQGERLTISERPKEIKDGEKLEMLAILGPVNPEADIVSVDVVGISEPVVREKGREYHHPRAMRFTARRSGDEFLTGLDVVEAHSSRWVDLGERRPLPNAARPKSSSRE